MNEKYKRDNKRRENENGKEVSELFLIQKGESPRNQINHK